ncbi:MAG: 2OG-Fe(II) oxygenase [Proteobacteria bacterium]|nr:2OG-Fe(II) oxygenase [Pseudomonadota bacterium]
MTGQDSQARFDAIVARAQAGNAEAQYAIGMILTRKNMNQALAWMQKSADAGYPQGLFMLGIWYGEGALLTQQPDKSYQFLQKASEAGFGPADYVLATALAKGAGTTPDWAGAVSIMINLAKKGEAKALSQLAFLAAMVPGGAGKEDADILLMAAANAGDPISQYALARRLLGADRPDQDKDQGKALLLLAAKSDRHVLAGEDPLIKKLETGEYVVKPFAAKPGWEKISDLLSALPIPDIAPRHDFETNPLIGVTPGFLSEEEADFVVVSSAPTMQSSQVVDHIQGKLVHRDFRTSTEMRYLLGTEDLVIHAINARISQVTDEPISHQEFQGVLRYERGQEYKPHSDYFLPDLEGVNPEVERAGQRVKTFLIYLNEGYEGGETEFIKLGLKLKGRKGDGLMFVNVNSDGGPHSMSLHAGRPVTEGVKWLTTLWIRDRDYTPPPVPG